MSMTIKPYSNHSSNLPSFNSSSAKEKKQDFLKLNISENEAIKMGIVSVCSAGIFGGALHQNLKKAKELANSMPKVIAASAIGLLAGIGTCALFKTIASKYINWKEQTIKGN